MEENKTQEETSETIKMGFFRKVWNSIIKIEKYPDMSAQGFGKAIGYMMKLVAIIAIVLSAGILFQFHQMLGEGIQYLENEFPEFSYKDGILNVETSEVLTIQPEDSFVGRTIIDTATEDEQVINNYINEIQEEGSGIVILKDRLVLKNSSIAGIVNYNYKEMLEPMGLTEINKQDVINYAKSTQIVNLYVSVFLTLFIYSFMMYFLTTLSNAVMLSVLGYFTAWVARIKMRYVAIFNMAVYALTLSVLLNIIYLGINIFVDFTMEYFQVMYITVAAIYLIAAIFILKSEFIKKQAELMKIAEAEKIVKKELEQDEQEKEEKEKQNERKEEDKKENQDEKDKKDTKQEGEPEGSNA